MISLLKVHTDNHEAKHSCQQTECSISPFVLLNLSIERDNLSKVFHDKAPIISGLVVNLNNRFNIIPEQSFSSFSVLFK